MLSALKSHKNAIEIGFIGTMLAVAVLSLPSFAEEASQNEMSESYYANTIVKLFQKVGAETASSYDNQRLETSAFDFIRYTNHTCFRPTEHDMAFCKDTFGPYFNLKTTQESGKLASILKGVSYLSTAVSLAKVTPNVVASSASSQVAKKIVTLHQTEVRSDTDERKGLDERSKVLWRLCLDKFTTKKDAARCYQRNIRRTMIETRLPGSDNVF